MKINKIPLFLHVPRSSGSYCLHAMESFFRRSCLDLKNVSVAHVRVLHPGASFLVTVRFNSNYWLGDEFMKASELKTPWQINREENKAIRECEYETLRGYLKNGEANILSIKTITDKKIDLRGSVFVAKELINEFGNESFNVTLLRDPVERAVSIHGYTSSQRSIHEPSHDASVVSLEQACLSNKIEDNWLTRSLNNYNGLLSSSWANNACHFLKSNSFSVFASNEANKCVTKVLQECFSERLKPSEKNLFRNSSNEKLHISQIQKLSREAKLRLWQSTKWDSVVFEHFFEAKKIKTLVT